MVGGNNEMKRMMVKLQLQMGHGAFIVDLLQVGLEVKANLCSIDVVLWSVGDCNGGWGARVIVMVEGARG